MGKMLQEGVTLIELLVTLSIVAIIVAVGVPALRDYFAVNHMSTAVNDLVTSLHVARSEAIKRETATKICPSTDWDTPNPTCAPMGSLADGWIVVIDPDALALVVLTHKPLRDSIQLNQDFIDSIEFTANGRPNSADANAEGEFNLLLCDDRGDPAGGRTAAGRWINIRGTGRPRIYTKRTDVQNILGGC